MARPVFTTRFKSDTNGILDYLERVAGPLVAEGYGRRFRATIGRLVDFPESGAPRPALGHNVRIAVISPYNLIYDYPPEGDEIILLRVLDGRRNITRALVRRK